MKPVTTHERRAALEWVNSICKPAAQAFKEGRGGQVEFAHPAARAYFVEVYYKPTRRMTAGLFEAVYPEAMRALMEAYRRAHPDDSPGVPMPDVPDLARVQTPEQLAAWVAAPQALTEAKGPAYITPGLLRGMHVDELEGLLKRIEAVIRVRQDVDTRLGVMDADQLKQALEMIRDELKARRKAEQADTAN